jgi:tryptophan halogenase
MIVKEIEEFLGYEPEYPRKDKGGFSFSAGCYEETWINNCVAVGLASSFIEPLEATSITGSLILLDRLLENPEWLFADNKNIRDEFNEGMLEVIDHVARFIYFHYLGERKDTEFWEKFSYKTTPEKLKEKLSLWKERFPNRDDSTNSRPYLSWLLVGLGISAVNKNLADKYIENSEQYRDSLKAYEYFVNMQNQKMFDCISHKEFLENLK